MKSITFHPKALTFIRAQSPVIKREIGEALRDLQKGLSLGSLSTGQCPRWPLALMSSGCGMPSVAGRVFCLVKLADRIVVFHGFQKKTQKTPAHEIVVGKQRLQEVLHGQI